MLSRKSPTSTLRGRIFRKKFTTVRRRAEIERISSCRRRRNVSLLSIKGKVLGASGPPDPASKRRDGSEWIKSNLETRNHNGFRFPFWIPGFQIYPDRLLPDSFLIASLRSTGSMRVQSKRATQRVALSETLSGCAFRLFSGVALLRSQDQKGPDLTRGPLSQRRACCSEQ
jgi:hypothetical protein